MNFNEIEPTTYDKYTFGKCIRLRREELGISVRKLSTILEMSPVYLSDIERGNRNAPTGKTAKKDFMSKLIIALKIPDEQVETFYDMAFVSRSYYKDIKEYLDNNQYARKAIRLAKEVNLSDGEWKEFISKLEEKVPKSIK